MIESLQADPPFRSMLISPRPAWKTILPMVLVALFIRLIVMYFLLPEQLLPSRPGNAALPEQPEHIHIGFEAGRIAYNIVEGRGFSSPLYAETGPTAWMTPVYPYVMAAAFKIFGTYTVASAVALLSLNALSSALVCPVVFFMALRTFGERAAKWAGWAWALCPYGIYFPAERIWETYLATLLMCLVFLWSLYLEEEDRMSRWAAYGALWGLGAMTSAVMVSVLPFLGVWLISRRHSLGKPWFRLNAIAAIAFFAVLAPWCVRNYRVFHRFIPSRDNLGMVLYLGANNLPGHWKPKQMGPWNNMKEWNEFQQGGELAYMDHKKQEAIEFIKAHPGIYAWKAVRRAVFIWTGFWSFDRDYLKMEPLDPPNIFFCTSLTVLALLGLRRAWKANRSTALPYLFVLLVFPVIYYFTTPELYYRRPMDPILSTLAAAALVPSKKKREEEPVEEEELVTA